MREVIIYTKPGCPYCAAAKEHYTRQGIEFTEINVFAVDGAQAKALELTNGKRMVPVIVDNGKVQVGFGGG